MQALRAGFRKNKEKRGHHTSGDLRPILSCEDSTGASPTNAPLSWEQFALKDDVQLLLADENLNEETPTENPMVFDSRTQTSGDESPLLGAKDWNTTDECEENIPPGNNHSKSKVRKIPKWKLAKFGAESEQPLLVQSTKSSSRVSDADRMTPKNISGWDSIQLEEATTPRSQRPMKNSFGTVLSPRHNTIAVCNTQTNNDSWNEEKLPVRCNQMEGTVQHRSKQVTTFDPFDDVDDFGLENHEEEVYQQTLLSSSEMVENEPHFNDHSLQNQEYHHENNGNEGSYMNHLEEEVYVSAENEYGENTYETEEVENSASETEQVTPDFYEENEQYVESDAVQPTTFNENDIYYNQSDYSEDQSNDFSADSEVFLAYTNEGTSNDVEDDSSLVSNGIYSVRKMEHIRSIYESKYARDDLNSPENEEGNIYQSSSESLEDDGNKTELRFVALLTEYSGILRQRTEQERAMSILLARNISNVVKIDGSSEENKDVRNMLFEISGKKGKYPQFFLQKDQNVIVYLGDFEWLQYMNDIGSMNDETIFGVSFADDADADVTHTASFADRAKAFDVCKQEPFRPEISPYHQAEEREVHSHNFVSGNMSPTDIDSQCFSDIKSVDVEEARNTEEILRPYGDLAITNESDEDMISCESVTVQNSDHGGPTASNAFPDEICDVEDAPESESAQIEDEVPSEDHFDSPDVADEPHGTQNEEDSNMETGSFSFRQSEMNERRAALESAGALLDGEFNTYGEDDVDRRDDIEQLESPSIENDEQCQEETEKQARRRARWKRRIIAEHLGSQYVDGNNLSDETEDPIGASEDEIEMINTFMGVLGSDFDGSLSSKELEKLHRRRARDAGLTEEFINKMFSAKLSPTASDAAYDDREFTRKTPQPKSTFGCFVESFWAESSNVVGDDMVQNIQAVLSGDSDESKRSLRTTGSTDSKSRWRSVEMIESIKASLSGDSNEKGWRPVDMIGTIKATLSGENNDVIESIKAAFSTDSTEKAKTENMDSEKGQPSAVAENSSAPEDLYEC